MFELQTLPLDAQSDVQQMSIKSATHPPTGKLPNREMARNVGPESLTESVSTENSGLLRLATTVGNCRRSQAVESLYVIVLQEKFDCVVASNAFEPQTLSLDAPSYAHQGSIRAPANNGNVGCNDPCKCGQVRLRQELQEMRWVELNSTCRRVRVSSE